ncbi:MAG: dephospho-CoA kinase, partial [Bdellovibrionia bacterium]
LLAPHHRIIIYEATLLVETGRYRDLSGLITVEAPEKTRLNRLQSRDSMNSQAAELMIHSQLSDAERKKHSDLTLDNSGTLKDLEVNIQRLVQERGWKSEK